MKGLSLREKVLLCILLIAALFYGYYKFYLNPMLSTMKETKSAIENLKVQEQRIKDAPAIKEQLTAKLNETSVLYKASLLEIPSQYRDSEISYDLKALCDANSATLTSISLGSGSTAANNSASTDGTNTNTNGNQGTPSDLALYSAPVVISVTGSYDSTMNLINAIENDTRTALVGSVAISKNAEGDSLTTSISLTYYYLDNSMDVDEVYDFNTGTYGKGNLFQ